MPLDERTGKPNLAMSTARRRDCRGRRDGAYLTKPAGPSA
jgi:hypothetical protein